MSEEEDLEALRKKKLEELQMQSHQQAAMEEQHRQIEAQRQTIMRQILTPQARERLGRLKIARPELVQTIEDQLIALARSGRVVGQIDDNDLRKLLSKLTPKKREIRIERR
jgi:programmed cell death protein 5